MNMHLILYLACLFLTVTACFGPAGQYRTPPPEQAALIEERGETIVTARSNEESCALSGGLYYDQVSEICLGESFNRDLANEESCERAGGSYNPATRMCLGESFASFLTYLREACIRSGGVFNGTDASSCSFDEAVNEYLSASCGNAGGTFQEGSCQFENSGIPERDYFTSQVRQFYESGGELYNLTFFVEQDFYAQQDLDERNSNQRRRIQRVYGVKSDIPGACLGLDGCENVNGELISEENPTSIWIIFDVTDNYGFEFIEGPDGRYYLNSEILGDIQQINWENSAYTVVTQAGELLSERIYLMYKPQPLIEVQDLNIIEFEEFIPLENLQNILQIIEFGGVIR